MATRNLPSFRSRLWLPLTILLLLAVCIGVQSLGRSPAMQRLWAGIGGSLGVEAADYKVYPTSTSPGDFYGRVYARTRTEKYSLKRADSLEEASALAGFQVLKPGWLPADLAHLAPETSSSLDLTDEHAYTVVETSSSLVVTGEHAYAVDIDFSEARRILETFDLSPSSLPLSLGEIEIAARVPPSTVTHQSQGERWYTLIQGGKPILEPPEGLNPGVLPLLDVLHLRTLGLSEAEAGQVSEAMGWGSFLVVPPTDLFSAEMIRINQAPALALQGSPNDSSLRAVLWESGGVLYGIYGSLDLDEMVEMAESLAP